VLTASPYNYAFETLVVVRVSASNVLGFGSTSAVNTAGALIRSIPLTMNAPTLVSKTDLDISITWADITGSNTGDSTILAYDLLWDNGLGTVSIQLIESLVNTYSVSSLTGGTTY
jgi:hypothetical protein